MAKKKKELYENESVESTREELEDVFYLYALFISSEDINNKLETAKEDNFYKCLGRELESGKYSSVSEAEDAVIESRKGAIYKRLGDTPEAAISIYKGIIGDISIKASIPDLETIDKQYVNNISEIIGKVICCWYKN